MWKWIGVFPAPGSICVVKNWVLMAKEIRPDVSKVASEWSWTNEVASDYKFYPHIMRCNVCVCGGVFCFAFFVGIFFLCRLLIAYESLQSREETRNSAWRKEGWDGNVYYTGKKEMLHPDALKTQCSCQGFIPRWLFLPAIIFSKVETRRSPNFFNHRCLPTTFCWNV